LKLYVIRFELFYLKKKTKKLIKIFNKKKIIAGDVLADVNLNPKNHHDYKENIDKVLKFMQLNSVKIARTTSKGLILFFFFIIFSFQNLRFY